MTKQAHLLHIAIASPNVVASGTVVPEAMTWRSLPTTSERMKLTRRRGRRGGRAGPCRPTQSCGHTNKWVTSAYPRGEEVFSDRVNLGDVGARGEQSLFTACFSSSVMPGAGAGISALPPPEMSATTSASLGTHLMSSTMRSTPRRPHASGSGCAREVDLHARLGGRDHRVG